MSNVKYQYKVVPIEFIDSQKFAVSNKDRFIILSVFKSEKNMKGRDLHHFGQGYHINNETPQETTPKKSREYNKIVSDYIFGVKIDHKLIDLKLFKNKFIVSKTSLLSISQEHMSALILTVNE